MRTLQLALLTSSLLLTSTLAAAQPALNAIFDQTYEEWLKRSPVEMSRQGNPARNFEWDDLGPEEPKLRAEILRRGAERARQAAAGQRLEKETALSLKLFSDRAELEERGLEFAEYDYPVNQMYGWHAEVPAFLANAHSVGNSSDAVNYLRRLEDLPGFFAQLIEGLKRREKKGILPPAFVFDYVLSDIDNLLSGFPLTETPDRVHPIYADFSTKVKALRLSPAEQDELLRRAQAALKNRFRPAYQDLRKTLQEQRSRATQDDGVWKFPQGDRFYAYQLATVTTTSLTAQEIHDLGLSEVERIHGEMRAIMKKVGFEGSLQEFFEFLRSDPRFVYSNDQAGRAAYLQEATAIVDRMRLQLNKLFLTQPKAPLVVKAVESYREKSAGKAFYESPALDGSRPGIYYANLYDMPSMPKRLA